jgi:hypothetical protein
LHGSGRLPRTYLRNDETEDAKRLHHRFRGELRLLDDLGWEREPDAEQFELTMPPRALRPIIERVYWSALAGLNNSPDELTEECLANLNEASVACPEMLARLADEFMDTGHEPLGVEAAAESIGS